MKHGVIWYDQGMFGYFAWPTVARLPGDTLIVVCSGFRMRHVCPFGKVVAFYSRDEGKTWSAPAVLMSGVTDHRDAGIVVRGDKVLVTTFTISKEVILKYQKEWYEDDWYTESPLGKIENEMVKAYLKTYTPEAEEKECGAFIMTGDGYSFGEKKRTLCSVSAPHGPFLLNDKSFMYVGLDIDAPNPKPICVIKSADGEKWEKVSEIPYLSDMKTEPCECHGIQLPSGKIIVMTRTQRVTNEGKIQLECWQCESTDGGKTFTPFRLAVSDGAPPHLLRHSSGALICSYASRDDRDAGPRAQISFDEGTTWTKKITLDTDFNSADLGYSSSVELKDGKILTVYYFNRKPRQDKTSIEYVIWDLSEATENIS